MGSQELWQQVGVAARWGQLSHCLHDTSTLEGGDFWPKDIWPPHSPDLVPMDFGIFPHLKERLSGKSFSKMDQLQRAIMTQ